MDQGNKYFSVRPIALGSLIALLVIISFRGSLSIRFGPVDDHEIFKFLGSDRKIFLYQIPNILWEQTEIGSWGDTARYRPSYYFLRVTETMLLGDRPYLWYLNRVLILFLTVFTFAKTILETMQMATLIRASITLFIVLTTLSLSGLAETTMRLGPAETYLLLGFAGFLLSSIALFKDCTNTRFWNLNLVSMVVAVGSKENAVALLVPFLYVLSRQIRKNPSVRIKNLIQGSIIIAFSVIIVLGPIVYISRTGSDVYGSTRSFENTVSSLLSFFDTSTSRISGIQVLVIFVCLASQAHVHHLIKWQSKALLFLSVSLFFVLIAEHIFYQGSFGEPRYELVSQISTVLIKGAMLIAIIDTASYWRRSVTLPAGLAFIVALFFSQSTITHYYDSSSNNLAVAQYKTQVTADYQIKISAIAEAIETDEYSGILVQINSVWDYEPAFAVSQYVALLEKSIPLALNVSVASVAPGLETSLLNQLNDFQENGSTVWRVQPRSELLPLRNLCIVFNEAPALPGYCSGVLSG